VKGKVERDQDWGRLQEMSEKIQTIERLILELKDLGKGMPVIEKNAGSILSFIYVLKCGISDVAEITDEERRY
jgi:hypothetical protein